MVYSWLCLPACRLRETSLSGLRSATFVIAFAAAACARADLSPRQVLLVYDSGSADSRLVAEHYAGSANVPGGAGGVAGARPAVLVLDLATIGGGGLAASPTITHAQFVAEYRDPIRTYLAESGLAEQVRAIVLTKGIPHRISDTDSAAVGDNPGAAGTEFTNRDATYASLDSELTLLWQDLIAGENGNAADSHADGVIINPYARGGTPVNGFASASITSTKSFGAATGFTTGQAWRAPSSLPSQRLSPGDMYLVCRLDGHTVADVTAMIDRARQPVVDTDVAVLILDESARTPDLDNNGPPITNTGNDYEQARDAALADGRFPAASVLYNRLSGPAGFTVGPLLSFDGEGIVVADPVLLLAHEGANHNGATPGQGAGPDPDARTLYAASFNYAPGAIFNTIESFNGRDFGGLGVGGTPQEQASDFIAAGGTFAIGMVYEPFAFAIADNEFLVRNFILGPMTWAEAAYTAIPVLSWQHVVIGDPLARLVRSSDDANGDGAVDVEDLYAWEHAPTDLNGDGVANAADRAFIEHAVRAIDAAGMAALRR